MMPHHDHNILSWQSLFLITFLLLFFPTTASYSDTNLNQSLKRAQYLLNASVPTDQDFSETTDQNTYQQKIRNFLNHDNFYNIVLRYHETLFGTGLPIEYMDELLKDDIDHKVNKFAQILCETSEEDQRLHCSWASEREQSKVSSCPKAWEEPVSVFWYPGIVAWVCPSLVHSCGNDLSRCFIEYKDEDIAANSELGTTEAFDSRYSVIKSLSKQSAGIATAVTIANYPYTKILEPGLTAVDGAIAHFYRQKHHFKLDQLNLSDELLRLVEGISLTDTRFHLIYTGQTYEHGGILSTFGWLRRYEKNRSRANQLYERLLCRKFTAELPKIFPQDPGNLREAPGCSGCHATLDPLADFFLAWGEGGELYQGQRNTVQTSFSGHSGRYLADIANIIRQDNAFATCTVEHVWEWLIGRVFHSSESKIRAALTNYFITTNYSFRELVYAIATHPTFMETSRGNSLVDDPLSEPPLGELPGGNDLPSCDSPIDFATDIQPLTTACTSCHSGNNTLSPLLTEADWDAAASAAISMMTSGEMPPGQTGPPRIGPNYEFKEKVRCWVERNKQ
ncbi:MAG: hypothetical protein H6618_04790 [Deltaproteobacteria bacterium]|nr:hypothetical protein [Deltaproteobacteria bacterium]